MKATTVRKIPVALLPACFLVLHVQDLYSSRDHHAATFLFCALFLGLIASAWRGIGARRGEETGRSKGTRVAARVLGVVLCAGTLVFHLFHRVHTPGWVAVFAVAAYGVFLLALFLPGRPEPALLSALACLLLALLVSPQPYQGAPLFPLRTVFFQTTALLCFGAFILCAAFNLGGRIVLALLVVSGVLLKFVSMGQWEINGLVRDMLPLIESALASVTDGRNPYGLHYLTHDVALTYLPVMWLSYLPAWAAGVDIRWINVLFAALCSVLIYRWGASREAGGPEGAWHERLLPASTGSLFLAAAVLFTLQSEVFWNSIHGEPPAYWFWVALFLSCIVARLFLPAAVLLGIVIATRHFGILFVPFFAVWLGIAGFSWKDAATRVLVTGATASLLIIPWMLLNPDAFLYGTVEWLLSYGPAYEPAWDYQIGFQSFFYKAKMADRLFIIQWAAYASMLAASAALSLRALRAGSRERAEKILWMGCALAYFVFVLFGNMVWKSFYVSILMVALMGFVPFREFAPVPLLRGKPLLGRALAAGLLAVNLLSLFFAGRALEGWRDRSDIREFAGKVAAGLKPTDLLVDHSYLNAWHVFQGSAFNALDTKPFVMTTCFPRNQELARYGRIVILDGYGLHDPGWDFPDLESTFEKAGEEESGRSKVMIYKNPAVYSEIWRLSRDPDALTEAAFESAAPPTINGRKIDRNFLFPGLDPWIFVGPYDCTIGGTAHASIFAQLMEGKSLVMTVRSPVKGDLWLLTAADDRVFTRPRGPVKITIESGSTRKELVHTGVRGMLTWYVGPVTAETIRVSFEGGKGSIGSLCFNLALSK